MSPDAPPLDFRNRNLLWASVIVETLYRLGLRTAVICPGSRSAPLTVAFAQHPEIEAIPVLDERSASFFALGIAQRSHRPVALVCTSGTAGANFYGAVIEARESGCPLLVLTADRPPELRHCHAGQAIDQIRLFGSYPNWQAELALPEATPERLAYLRQTLIQSWERSLFPMPGPVHLNVPLRDPLAPVPEPEQPDLGQFIDAEAFFATVQPLMMPQLGLNPLPDGSRHQRGLIVVGLAQPSEPVDYCEAIACLAKALNWPVLTDALNPLRNFQGLNPNLICHYDQILRLPQLAQDLRPDAVIRIGELPTSKVLRQWLSQQDCSQWVVSDRPDNFDPLHARTQHLRTSVTALAAQLAVSASARSTAQGRAKPPSPGSEYLLTWTRHDRSVADAITRVFQQTDALREPKVAWLLSQGLPEGTPLFIANSTPVRDLEWFWQKGDCRVLPHVNRGANGIDGTLSTAVGMAQASSQPCVMLTGDLALLHDTNGFLLAAGLMRSPAPISLTIVLINNNGGGIFELLPISQFDPPFEQFFATPQAVAFERLCATYGVEHCKIQTWAELSKKLKKLPERGVQVLEICTDRKADAVWRSQLLSSSLS